MVTENIKRIGEKTEELAGQAEGGFEETVQEARDWLQENSGKAMTAAGIVLVAGLVGYLIGHQGRSDTEIAS